uniref:J domain-containing protein n=1 Tax=Noctiluca scintillans TaxID=2966 RepID=A0A7S1FBL5_NOCSC|mmetsp:Transcript_47941/g.126968  ORF Transcript_47941/g.126968 Transcript_47941/m.126968 type:complete len:309 (+) Transcript_47941:50-976(+)
MASSFELGSDERCLSDFLLPADMDAPLQEGDLVRVPLTSIAELGGSVMDLDELRDQSIGKVCSVERDRFLPFCVVFFTGYKRYFAESSLRRAQVMPSREWQLRRMISEARQNCRPHDLPPDAVPSPVPSPREQRCVNHAKVEPPPPDCSSWADAQLRSWRRSHKQKNGPTKDTGAGRGYSDELLREACNVTGLDLNEMAGMLPQLVREEPETGPLEHLPLTSSEWAAMYAELGLPTTVGFDVVRAVFSVLAWRCHPDRGGSLEELHKLFRAYDALSRHESARVMPVKPLDAPPRSAFDTPRKAQVDLL